MNQATRETAPEGILVIDKPTGMTSHDVVSKLRKILNTKKVGHTGTLDPFATGVLVMMVGKATRLAKFIDKDDKTYEALMRFGFATDTGDRDGAALGTPNSGGDTSSPTESVNLANPDLLAFVSGLKSLPPRKELLERIEAALPTFSGTFLQTPPMYSAKKVKGKKLYELAREGKTIEREPVEVSVSSIEIDPSFEAAENEVLLKVTCSAGTYIRTLAEDIGKTIDVPCHLAELRRTKAGVFKIEQANALAALEQGRSPQFVSMSEAVSHLPVQKVGDNQLALIKNGSKIPARILKGTVPAIRLTDENNDLIAIGELTESSEIQPRLVFI